MNSQNNETWHLWLDTDRNPYANMAIDETLLLNINKIGSPLIRIYGWNTPSISIGYVQDLAAVNAPAYTFVRRPTGGGIVYHDKDLTYTAVVPVEHPICKLDRMESYHVFHRAVLKVLAFFGLRASLSDDSHPVPDRATMQCFITPTRYDVLCDSKKYAGAAQRRTRDGILHQGSVMLSASNGDRKLLSERLIIALREEFNISFQDFEPDEDFMKSALALEQNKYSKESWNKAKDF